MKSDQFHSYSIMDNGLPDMKGESLWEYGKMIIDESTIAQINYVIEHLLWPHLKDYYGFYILYSVIHKEKPSPFIPTGVSFKRNGK